MDRKAIAALVSTILFTVVAGCGLGLSAWLGGTAMAAAPAAPSSAPAVATKNPGSAPTVELTEKQLHLVQVAPLTSYAFKIEKVTIGSITFNEDREVQVFTPYQGRIIDVFVKLDDQVKAGQPLFTIDSSDLIQAESTLIQTAGVAELTKSTLSRVRRLVPAGGGAQKDLEQAVSDQQTAEGNLKAARDALHIYGKTDADIDRIVGQRVVDSTLVVKSPIDGIVAARNAAPGLLVQPGTAPAPLTIADLRSKWMVASAAEADSTALRAGQEVTVQPLATPGRSFKGRVFAIGQNIDPATRRFMVRSEIDDPDNILRPGMFANFAITTGTPVSAPALPVSGAVREGDGTMTAWTTQDGHLFTQQAVKLGLEQNGLYQVVDGLRVGAKVVTDGAIFLDNVLNAAPTD